LLYSGDIIAEINGKPMTDIREVLSEVGLEYGKRLSIKLIKANGDRADIALVTAAEREH
jgi:hypothetical protein